MAVGTGLPMAISMPGRTPAWARNATPADVIRFVQAADRLGYAYTTVSDHTMVPHAAVESMGDTWYAPFPTLAFVAAATQRIRLCTHVLVVPYRHPLIVARDVGTLDHLSGGRVILGVGPGYLRREFRALGLDPSKRGTTTDAYLAELERMWREQTDFVVRPRPVQQPRPRLWVGGNTARALGRALEQADGWVPWMIELDAMRALIDEMGHPGEVAFPWSCDPLGVDGEAHTLDRCLTDLARLRQAGITAVTAGFPNRSLDELLAQMEMFAAEVMPRAAVMD